jgi:hypothetical protein
MFDISDKKILSKKEVTFLVIRFLRKKMLLDEFCEEYKTYHCVILEATPKAIVQKAVKQCYDITEFFRSLESSFLWRKTRRGYYFWYCISQEWDKYTRYKQFKYDY